MRSVNFSPGHTSALMFRGNNVYKSRTPTFRAKFIYGVVTNMIVRHVVWNDTRLIFTK